MEFEFSDVVKPSSYDSLGLCDSVPLRQHRDHGHSEVKGAKRAQKDWETYVHPVGDYHGGLGDKFTFIRVTVPECRPERLEIVSYANEYAFLYDDDMEKLGHDSHLIDNSLLDVFDETVLECSKSNIKRGEKQLQSQILDEMMVLDPLRATTSMKAWARFVQQAADRKRNDPFSGLHEYIPYRVIDAGEMIWFATLTFGMALTIPESELAMCRELTFPGYAAISLTNDLLSWNKEKTEAAAADLPEIVNAIWVIMKESKVSEQEAKDICAEEIRKYVGQFVEIVKETKSRQDVSVDTKRYVEAVMYSLSGNLVWSLYCPRYGKFRAERAW